MAKYSLFFFSIFLIFFQKFRKHGGSQEIKIVLGVPFRTYCVLGVLARTYCVLGVLARTQFNYLLLESSAPLRGASFYLLRRAQGPFRPTGDSGGRTDNGFKGVR